MRIPPPVQKIQLVAPSSPIPPERLARGQARLQELGFEVRPPVPMEAWAYLAGPDERRRALIAAAWTDPEVDGIMSTRGGYGAGRLIELDPERWLPHADRALIGFSDVTVLHLLMQSRGLCSIHAPGAGQIGDLAEDSVERFCEVLRGHWEGLSYPAQGPVLAEGEAEGPLVGGCLSVIASVAGTGLLNWPEGSILLLEDIGEVPYRLDRCLTQLRSVGAMARVAGVIVGDLIHCDAPQPDYPSPIDVLRERLSDLGVPVLAGLPIGHGDKNWAFPLGARARVDTKTRSMTILQPGPADL